MCASVCRSYKSRFVVFHDSVNLCPQGFLCLVSTIPLPFLRCRFAVPVSCCRFRTPLLLPLRIFLLFTAVTERNFLTYFFHRTTEFYNGGTAKRQRNGGNGALVLVMRRDATSFATLNHHLVAYDAENDKQNTDCMARRYLNAEYKFTAKMINFHFAVSRPIRVRNFSRSVHHDHHDHHHHQHHHHQRKFDGCTF